MSETTPFTSSRGRVIRKPGGITDKKADALAKLRAM